MEVHRGIVGRLGKPCAEHAVKGLEEFIFGREAECEVFFLGGHFLNPGKIVICGFLRVKMSIPE